MFSTVEEYLYALKKEIQGCDSATIQDALTDAEEHLRTALETARESQPEMDAAATLPAIIEQYGSPEETAAAYAEVERRTSPSLARPVNRKQRTGLGRFFGVYADPKAWGALLYMLIAFVTGAIYFTWAVTGISVSLSFALFIFGLPVMAAIPYISTGHSMARRAFGRGVVGRADATSSTICAAKYQMAGAD